MKRNDTTTGLELTASTQANENNNKKRFYVRLQSYYLLRSFFTVQVDNITFYLKKRKNMEVREVKQSKANKQAKKMTYLFIR